MVQHRFSSLCAPSQASSTSQCRQQKAFGVVVLRHDAFATFLERKVVERGPVPPQLADGWTLALVPSCCFDLILFLLLFFACTKRRVVV